MEAQSEETKGYSKKPTVNNQLIGLILVNVAVSLVMLCLANYRATAGAMEFYSATIPVMLQAGLGAAVGFIGLVFSRIRYFCLIINILANSFLGIPALSALSQWPGGDDGGAFGWIVIVGGGCAVSFFVALVTLIMSFSRRGKTNVDSSGHSCGEVSSQNSPTSVTTGTIVNGESKTKRGSKLGWIMLAIAGAYMIWIIAGPIKWHVMHTKSYPGGIEIRSIDYHELTPLFPIPFYHHVNADHEKSLIVNGKEVMQSDTYTRLFPSPDGSYVAAFHYVYNGPVRIYNTKTLQCIELSNDDVEKEFPGNDYVYPFTFLRWENDKSFLVEITGTDFDHNLSKYRHVLRIDAQTGLRTHVE